MKTLKHLAQYLIGAVLLIALVTLAISITEYNKKRSLPEGWSILRGPGEVSALLVNGPEIWAGGRDGLTIIDITTLGTVTPEMPKMRYIRSMQRAGDGSIWIAHSLGVSRFYDGQWTHISPKTLGLTGPAYAIFPEAPDAIWVGGKGGLTLVSNQEFTAIPLPAPSSITAVSTIFRDSGGVLWVGSDSHINGGLLSRGQDGAWQEYHVGQELHHASVTGIIEDSKGTLWVATGFAGHGALSLNVQGSWEKLQRDETLDNRKVRSVYEDTAGRIWLGYEYDGLSIYDGQNWRKLTYSDGLAGEEVKAVVQDAQGTYWIATPRGVSVIKASAFSW